MHAAYCRGSTLKQALTIEAQRASIAAWCKYQGIPEGQVTWYCESESSSLRGARPEFARMMQELRDGGWIAKTVVCAKLDRLSRSVAEFSELLDTFTKLDTDLVVLDVNIDTSNATGRLIAHVLISLAQWEREVIGERTVAALDHKRAKGAKLGQAPYGFRKVVGPDGKLTVLEKDPEEQRILAEIYRAALCGAGIEAIICHLNDGGRRTRSGRPWHRRTIQDILRRRK